MPIAGLIPLLTSLGLYTLVQASPLLAIARAEPKLGFLVMSYGLFFIRNLSWIAGLLKALVYVLQSPPELDAAARWRAHRHEDRQQPTVVATEPEPDPEQIEPAKAESAH